MTSSLLHVEKESLEVLAFRVVDVDGVVSGLVQTIEENTARAKASLSTTCEQLNVKTKPPGATLEIAAAFRR